MKKQTKKFLGLALLPVLMIAGFVAVAQYTRLTEDIGFTVTSEFPVEITLVSYPVAIIVPGQGQTCLFNLDNSGSDTDYEYSVWITILRIDVLPEDIDMFGRAEIGTLATPDWSADIPIVFTQLTNDSIQGVMTSSDFWLPKYAGADRDVVLEFVVFNQGDWTFTIWIEGQAGTIP